MTTRAAIKAITDAGLFEQLCSAILRKKRPDLDGFSHMGTNSQGQTKKGPIDGFKMRNENGKIAFVAIQHTINKNIRTKWLGASGDIHKTEQKLGSLRMTYPGADFELILTTSTIPDIELFKTLATKSNELNLRINCLLDQSSIADYLDHEPDGQWLRNSIWASTMSFFLDPP